MNEQDRSAIDKMKICIECDRFVKITKQCKECGCFMPLKVRWPGMHCPLNKW